MSETPEFSRPVALERIGAGETVYDITADEAERAALARRFGLAGIDALSAGIRLARDGESVRARGTVTAEVVQSCVATGDPVAAPIAEPFELRFVPQEAAPAEEERELDEAECETLFYAGGAIDLGEAAAQTMALALDPFPRSARAEAALREAGIVSEEEAGPFGALRQLRDSLGGAKKGR